MSEFSVFSEIDDAFTKIIEGFTKIISNNISHDLAIIMGACLTLYVILFGIGVWFGKIQSPGHEFVYNILRMLFLIAIIDNSGGILDIAKNAVLSFGNIGSGGAGNGENGIGYLDDSVIVTAQVIARFADTVPWYMRGFVLILFWASWFMFTVPIFGILLVSKITLYFLLAFAPLFIFFLMWGFLKDSFARYLKALMTTSLIMLSVKLMQIGILEFMLKVFEDNKYNNGDVFIVGVMMLAGAFIANKIIFFIVAVMRDLIGVSVDTAHREYQRVESAKRIYNNH